MASSKIDSAANTKYNKHHKVEDSKINQEIVDERARTYWIEDLSTRYSTLEGLLIIR
jgi:hypothetical protein